MHQPVQQHLQHRGDDAALSEATILGHIRQLGLARTKAKHVRRLAERCRAWGTRPPRW